MTRLEELMAQHYPHLSREDQGHLLWNATCYPFGKDEQIEAQLIELKANTDGSLDQAMAYADKQMREAMAEFRKREVAP